jgi:hypothetical protein
VLNHIYAKDAHRVFYLSGWIKEADVKTFRVLDEGRILKAEFARGPNDELAWDYQGFACDAHFVFFDDMMEGKACVLRGADPGQFNVLEHGYGRDEKLVYYGKGRAKGANPKRFQVVSRFYAADDEKVFYMEREVAGAEPASFKVLANCWARDDRHAFFQDGLISNADAATFGIIDQGFARDAARVYRWMGKVLEHADPETFEQIGDSLYYRDERAVYYCGYPSGWLEDADPTTFKPGPAHSEGRDRQWTYRGCEKRGPRQE